MAKDKFSALWLSYSSIRDYLSCPRAYFLRNMYRDPKTHHKITVVSGALSLGQVVHDVIEQLSQKPASDRFTDSLESQFEERWKQVSGKKGGFKTADEEASMKEKGRSMIQRIEKYPGPLLKKAIKIRQELPYMWLSEEENMILCGKIDWLIYDEKREGVTILDFKTGKYDEDPDSLQLPIYHVLVKSCQTHPVLGASYWYLNRDSEPVDVPLPEYDEAMERIMEIAKRIALARKLERFVCKQKDGCRACLPLEAVLQGKGEFVGESNYHQDLYIV